jgi:pyruvate,water dikinase
VLRELRGEGAVARWVAAERRAAWLAACRTPPPRAFGRRLRLPPLDALPAEARLINEGLVQYLREIMATPDVYAEPSPRALEVRGVPAVGGRYVGVARVIRGEADFGRLQEGDVLVCPMTSPAWAALLPLAGALVTDHGGTLSHAAVIAREFGIPAVVATAHATGVIPDGATVEVDGDAGTVRVVALPEVVDRPS